VAEMLLPSVTSFVESSFGAAVQFHVSEPSPGKETRVGGMKPSTAGGGLAWGVGDGDGAGEAVGGELCRCEACVVSVVPRGLALSHAPTARLITNNATTSRTLGNPQPPVQGAANALYCAKGGPTAGVVHQFD
jgi:hypothetical protein